MNKFIYYFRKFSSYILFIFTLLSFIFTENEWLLLTLVSIAFLAFFKINFLELFKKKRYLSKLELFFSILLLIRILLLFEVNIYYKVLTYSLGLFFIVVYFFNFSNTENVTTNILGVKKNEEESNLEDGFDQEDYESDEEYLEEDEDSQEQEDYESDEEYLEEDEDEFSQDQEEDFVERKDSLKTKKKAELPKKSKTSKK